MSADTRRLIQKQLKEDTQMAGMPTADRAGRTHDIPAWISMWICGRTRSAGRQGR